MVGDAAMEWGDAFWEYPVSIMLRMTSLLLLEALTSWPILVLLLNQSGDIYLFAGREARHFRLPWCGNRMLFLPRGSAWPSAKGFAPLEAFLTCWASLRKGHLNGLRGSLHTVTAAMKLKDTYSLEGKLSPTLTAYSKAETLLCQQRSV